MQVRMTKGKDLFETNLNFFYKCVQREAQDLLLVLGHGGLTSTSTTDNVAGGIIVAGLVGTMDLLKLGHHSLSLAQLLLSEVTLVLLGQLDTNVGSVEGGDTLRSATNGVNAINDLVHILGLVQVNSSKIQRDITKEKYLC